MATKTMDDVDQAETGESKDNGQSENNLSENAMLRERLMRALAETENIRRQGERRAQDAQQYAITEFARELLQVVNNLPRAIDADAARSETAGPDGLIEGVVATDRILTEV